MLLILLTQIYCIGSHFSCKDKQSWTKSCGKIDKLSKIDFPMECFTADFLRDFAKKVKTWLLGGRVSAFYQIQAFQGFSCSVLIS